MKAALCYYMAPLFSENEKNGSWCPNEWPWENKWWKPCPDDRVRELTKAGALFKAQMERDKNVNEFCEMMLDRCEDDIDQIQNYYK